MEESEIEIEVPGELYEEIYSEFVEEEFSSAYRTLSEILDSDIRRQLAEGEVAPAPEEEESKPLTLDELIKDYVRTMHIPPVTDWKDLSDSEEEEQDDEHKDAAKYKAERKTIAERKKTVVKHTSEETMDEWELMLKEKTASALEAKKVDEKFRFCLLDIKSYGTLFHEPYIEMEMRQEEQCDGCRDFKELGRCVCCGGASFISTSCCLHNDHVKQRLVKEARVYRLMEENHDFSETELLECNSSHHKLINICTSSHSSSR